MTKSILGPQTLFSNADETDLESVSSESRASVFRTRGRRIHFACIYSDSVKSTDMLGFDTLIRHIFTILPLMRESKSHEKQTIFPI